MLHDPCSPLRSSCFFRQMQALISPHVASIRPFQRLPSDELICSKIALRRSPHRMPKTTLS